MAGRGNGATPNSRGENMATRYAAGERSSERAAEFNGLTSNRSLLWPSVVASSSYRSFSSAFTVGRSRQCELVIPTSDDTRTISKIHARIFPMQNDTNDTGRRSSFSSSSSARPSSQKWLLQDLNTLNGTAINGMDLMPGGTVQLHDGDEVLLSSTMRNGVRLSIQIPDNTQSRVIIKVYTGSQQRTTTFGTSPVWRGTVASASAREPSTPRSASPVIMKRRRSAEQHAAERRGENGQDAATGTHDNKRAKHDDADDRERFMVCSVCLDYFYNSATLTCSHTFCGHCISNWFRTSPSLSCPECRAAVKHLPVRNRALDDLVHKLVGDSETYQAVARKRSSASSACSSSARGLDLCTHPLVFNRWSPQEMLAFNAFITKQFGDARVSAFRPIGLTESAIEGASASELLVAAQNLLLDCVGLRASHEASDRLKIHLHYG